MWKSQTFLVHMTGSKRKTSKYKQCICTNPFQRNLYFSV